MKQTQKAGAKKNYQKHGDIHAGFRRCEVWD
jgi:hypothetical protein